MPYLVIVLIVVLFVAYWLIRTGSRLMSKDNHPIDSYELRRYRD